MRTGRASVPVTLAYLLAPVLLLTLAWAAVVPPWRAPDEHDHFAYVQALICYS